MMLADKIDPLQGTTRVVALLNTLAPTIRILLFQHQLAAQVLGVCPVLSVVFHRIGAGNPALGVKFLIVAVDQPTAIIGHLSLDRKSTRLHSSHVKISY